MGFDSKQTKNYVLLIGRLGQAPELKYTPSNSAVCTLSIATNTSYKGADGKYVDETEWSRVVLWGKQAENAAKFLIKGSRVLIEGKLKTRSWEKDGVKHYATEVVADSFQMMDGKGEAAAQHESEAPTENPNSDDESDGLPF